MAWRRSREEATGVSGVQGPHHRPARHHRRRHDRLHDGAGLRRRGPEGHPARGPSHRPGRHRPRERLLLERSVRVVPRSRRRGRDAASARALFEESSRAPRELAATVKRLGIKADLHIGDALRVIPAGQPDKILRRDAADRDDAGLHAPWQLPAAITRSVAVPAAGGIRLKDWGFVDPYRLALGFAAAALKRRAKFFERSRVARITFDRKVATIALENGSTIVTARRRAVHGRAHRVVQGAPPAFPLRGSLHGDDRAAPGRRARRSSASAPTSSATPTRRRTSSGGRRIIALFSPARTSAARPPGCARPRWSSARAS